MPGPKDSRWALAGALAVLCGLTGCCGPASMRSSQMEPTPAGLAGHAALVDGARGGVPSAPGVSSSPCLTAPNGLCGDDACAPIFPCLSACCLGPLCLAHGSGQPELEPPLARFHPVPTAPVFGNRDAEPLWGSEVEPEPLRATTSPPDLTPPQVEEAPVDAPDVSRADARPNRNGHRSSPWEHALGGGELRFIDPPRVADSWHTRPVSDL